MIITVENLVKKYKGNLVLDGISFNIRTGEIHSLLGPNGAGKTTIINALLGLIKFDSGNIKIFNKSIEKMTSEIKKNIGYVPQEVAIFEELNAFDNVAFFAKLYEIKKSDIKDFSLKALEFVGLLDKKKEFPSTFSGGMKRRLNIACAIVHKPKLIIMDEPTVGIDPHSRNEIIESIRKLNEEGATIIYTTHYLHEIEDICNNITILHKGKIIAEGTKDDILKQFPHDEKISIELSGVKEDLKDKINKIIGVKEVKLDENKLLILTTADSKNIGVITKIILDNGIEIKTINVEKPNLEEVFLTLTKTTRIMS